MQVLYQLDVQGSQMTDKEIEHALHEQGSDPETLSYARETVFGYRENKSHIDGKIEDVAKNWELKRMSFIDRNIIRLAAYEMLFRADIPPLVAINEAIELAKKFGSKHSGPFVNGILDNIRRKFEGEAVVSGNSRKT
ncbi:MAG: transcription antitermination factor NusB [Planctomycetes bacterium RBG_16_59_8]|nr:MAG: transcription antitermination factor NusB [Planctomycetes bacterium RBG_16_59_8]